MAITAFGNPKASTSATATPPGTRLRKFGSTQDKLPCSGAKRAVGCNKPPLALLMAHTLEWACNCQL